MLNLDTHILVFALAGSLRLEELALLESHRWSISAIVLWEVAKLNQLGRISLSLDSPAFIRALAQIHVWPLDLAVCRMSTRLDFRGDPADELVAATSVVFGVPLVTRDATILGSRMVPVAGAEPGAPPA